MHLTIALVAAVSLAMQPMDVEGPGEKECFEDALRMTPAAFSRLTGINTAPDAEIRMDLDGDCVTGDEDILRWLGSEDATRFLDQRDIRLTELVRGYRHERLGWEDAVLGDINADDVVDHQDLLSLALQFGKRPADATSPAVDVSGDGVIDAEDLARLLGQWGERSEDDLRVFQIALYCGFEFLPAEDDAPKQ